MKILFINPPRSYANKVLDYAPEKAKKFVHKKLIGPPIGLLTIATYVKDISDAFFIDLKGEYDLNANAPDLAAITCGYLNEYDPDIVAVTFIASEYYFGIDIFKTAKKYNKDIITVAGGLHTTLCLEDFNNEYVDFVCPLGCPKPFRDLVIALKEKKNIESVKGVYFNKSGKLKLTKPVDYKWDPVGKDYIIPDRSFLKRWINTYKVGKSPHPATYIYTSLGCPYKCTFCSIWQQFNGDYLQRDVESIINELKSVDEYYVVRFSDANTIVNADFINKLFDRIEEEKIKKFFIMDIRFDTAVNHPELIEKLAKNGLKVVICGFESFREQELKKYNKSSSAHLIEKAIDIFHQNGIMLRGNYIVPNYYTERDFDALEEYAASHKVVYAGYSILTPMPGTVFYNEVKSDIIDFDLSKYNFF
ncbi:MAG: B12-binding domain-containing radical SAM protein, partial [Spirochaetes bacterium]|nr:B12-binding domain-containing radical SAM protein [Spirochaetota bacterium]